MEVRVINTVLAAGVLSSTIKIPEVGGITLGYV
jgi:hypothetical protein